MPKFAANLTMLFNDVPFLDRFALAREAGFDGVEFLFPYAYDADQIAERLRRHQLQLVLFNLPCGDWDAGDRGMACDPRRLDEFRAASTRRSNMRSRWTSRSCTAWPANCRPAGARTGPRHLYRQPALRRGQAGAPRHRCADRADQPLRHARLFPQPSQQAADIIAEAACPILFLQYDIYHMQRMEGELANTIRARLPLIRHMQIADTRAATSRARRNQLPPPVRLIDELGYDGWLGCEYRPATHSPA
jgi:hydroxypyruvate isomerase